jgi:hypothetical protein
VGQSDVYVGTAALGCPPGEARLPDIVHLTLSSRAKVAVCERTATPSKDPYTRVLMSRLPLLPKIRR